MSRRKRLTSVAQAQAWAKRRLPRSVYSFIEVARAPSTRCTTTSPCSARSRSAHEPRPCSNRCRLTTTVLGDELSMPVIVAPTGLIRIAHRGGEVAARARGREGPDRDRREHALELPDRRDRGGDDRTGLVSGLLRGRSRRDRARHRPRRQGGLLRAARHRRSGSRGRAASVPCVAVPSRPASI